MPSALFIGSYLPDGAGSRCISLEIAARLARDGWDVAATSYRRGRAARLADMLWSVWSARDRYRVAHVDVYSGLAFRWSEVVCCLLRALHKPFVLTLHGGNLPAFAGRQRRRVRALLARATAVTAPSPYLLEQMRPYCAGLRLLPNPVALGDWPFRLRRSAAPRLVWLRAFHQVYNPSLAPQVMARLVARVPDIGLTMIGPDKGDGHFALTRRAAAELRLLDRISFLPPLPHGDVPAALQTPDIFLNTSNIDNTPVSLLEAMACGLCVVSTSVGGIPYLLRHEEDALLVPPRDPDAMAAAVLRLLTEPALAARLSANARRKAGRFDWSRILPQWRHLLLSVAGA